MHLLTIMREYKSMTRTELADKAGITLATVSRIESGKRRGNPDTWRKLQKALDIDDGQLGLLIIGGLMQDESRKETGKCD